VSLGRLPGGFVGVTMFFALSGFFITRGLLLEHQRSQTLSLRDFYARRVLRIAPALIGGVLLAGLLWPTFGTNASFSEAALSSLLFFANFTPEMSGPLGHYWSLAVEEHFYIVWPLALSVLLARGISPVYFLVTIILVVLLARFVAFTLGAEDQFIYRATFMRADAIAFGCLLALPSVKYRPPTWLAWCCALLFVAALPFATPGHFLMATIGHTVYALAAVTVIAFLLTAKATSLMRRVCRYPLVAFIGERSFGIYVYHGPILTALAPLHTPGSNSSAICIALLTFALTFALAEVSYRYLEQPAMASRPTLLRAISKWRGSQSAVTR
jgi:peptidoglycan/LPS O-acetylase OafA/YrhL